MAQKQYKTNYINGVFVKRITIADEEIFLMDISNDALNEIYQLPENDKGFHRLKISPQKNDRDKLSVSENDYVPKEKPAGRGNSGGGFGKQNKPKRTPF